LVNTAQVPAVIVVSSTTVVVKIVSGELA
jgi:hypothetical protein